TVIAIMICLPAFRHKTPCAFCLVLENVGNSSAARIPMMAMTTSSSISVNARRDCMIIKTLEGWFCFKLFRSYTVNVRRPQTWARNFQESSRLCRDGRKCSPNEGSGAPLLGKAEIHDHVHYLSSLQRREAS